jgi:hypothetical protein
MNQPKRTRSNVHVARKIWMACFWSELIESTKENAGSRSTRCSFPSSNLGPWPAACFPRSSPAHRRRCGSSPGFCATSAMTRSCRAARRLMRGPSSGSVERFVQDGWARICAAICNSSSACQTVRAVTMITIGNSNGYPVRRKCAR